MKMMLNLNKLTILGMLTSLLVAVTAEIGSVDSLNGLSDEAMDQLLNEMELQEDYDKRRAPSFVGKRDYDKRTHMFVGKKSDDEPEKRTRLFVGKKDYEVYRRPYPMDRRLFVGRRGAHMFVGKRSDIEPIEDDKRGSRMFVGKRNGETDDDLVKRNRMFVGKRSEEIGDEEDDIIDDMKRNRMFVGKRNRMFVGKRESDEMSEDDLPYYLIDDEFDNQKRAPRLFVGKRDDEYDELEDLSDFEKRNRMFVGKKNRMFVGKKNRMFVGKRPTTLDEEVDKRRRMFVGKRVHDTENSLDVMVRRSAEELSQNNIIAADDVEQGNRDANVAGRES